MWKLAVICLALSVAIHRGEVVSPENQNPLNDRPCLVDEPSPVPTIKNVCHSETEPKCVTETHLDEDCEPICDVSLRTGDRCQSVPVKRCQIERVYRCDLSGFTKREAKPGLFGHLLDKLHKKTKPHHQRLPYYNQRVPSYYNPRLPSSYNPRLPYSYNRDFNTKSHPLKGLKKHLLGKREAKAEPHLFGHRGHFSHHTNRCYYQDETVCTTKMVNSCDIKFVHFAEAAKKDACVAVCLPTRRITCKDVPVCVQLQIHEVRTVDKCG